MDTEFPYDKGGETLLAVADGIFENLCHTDKYGVKVMSLTKGVFEEICKHIAEWQRDKLTEFLTSIKYI